MHRSPLEASSIEAPDFSEPFLAWRVWRVHRDQDEYLLGSVVQPTVWPAGEALAATCLRGGGLWLRLRRRPRHEAPESRCECGIYAAPLRWLGQYLANPACGRVARVIGEVALWGTVIECERGFRASHAYPRRIYVPADAGDPWRVDWQDVAEGLLRYRVPLEPLESRAAEASRLLSERPAP